MIIFYTLILGGVLRNIYRQVSPSVASTDKWSKYMEGPKHTFLIKVKSSWSQIGKDISAELTPVCL